MDVKGRHTPSDSTSFYANSTLAPLNQHLIWLHLDPPSAFDETYDISFSSRRDGSEYKQGSPNILNNLWPQRRMVLGQERTLLTKVQGQSFAYNRHMGRGLPIRPLGPLQRRSDRFSASWHVVPPRRPSWYDTTSFEPRKWVSNDKIRKCVLLTFHNPT